MSAETWKCLNELNYICDSRFLQHFGYWDPRHESFAVPSSVGTFFRHQHPPVIPIPIKTSQTDLRHISHNVPCCARPSIPALSDLFVGSAASDMYTHREGGCTQPASVRVPGWCDKLPIAKFGCPLEHGPHSLSSTSGRSSVGLPNLSSHNTSRPALPLA